MKPLISIIVPIYKVELYLRKCIESIIRQTYYNLEIILVDDGSPDNCPAICDEYAEKDSRIKVIHKQNGGLSSARNAGLDIMTGDYVGFVDPDDWIAPDMFEYLLQGLQEYDADISVCGYFNVYKKKLSAVRRERAELFKGDDALMALLRLKIGNYAWNKLYKRTLWKDMRFDVGKNYEDVRIMYKIMGNVNKAVLLPDAKYFYLDNNFGIVKTESLPNMISCVESRMERYDRLDCDYRNQIPWLKEEIYRYTIALRDAVFKKSKSQFESEINGIRYVAEFLSRHRDDFIACHNWGITGKLIYSCLSTDKRYLWCLSKLISAAYKRIMNFYPVKKYKDFTERKKREKKLKIYYRLFKKLPLQDNTALLESRGGTDFASNIFYIAQELCARNMKVYLSVCSNDLEKVRNIAQKGLFPGLEIVLKFSDEYYRVFAAAKYLFNDMVYDSEIMKKPGQVWCNVWHGTPLKTLEYNVKKQRHEMGGATREFIRSDYLIAPSKFMADKLIDSACVRNICKSTEVLYTGYPRNSVFFDDERRALIRKECNLSDKEVFVYMPTWRGSFYNQQASNGEYALQKILEFFERNLNDNQILFVKLHNLERGSVDISEYMHVKSFPDTYETYEFLNAADCLITDYSSVFFDFANTGRKIILFTYDEKKYLSERGMYISLDSLPFTRANSFAQLLPQLNVEKSYSDNAFIEQYCTYDCKFSAKQLLDCLLAGKKVKSEKITGNGKKNVLLYDESFNINAYLQERILKKLAEYSDDDCNYYYAYRMFSSDKCAKYLQELPEHIKPYSLNHRPTVLIPEMLAVKLFRCFPETLIKREQNREMYQNPFDELVILFENKYDLFHGLINALVKNKYSVK